MKLHWWIAGFIVAVASGVLVMKHFTNSKDKYFDLMDKSNENNCGGYPTDINESEFEGTEFII
jgi:hypothetical protein